MKFGLLSFFLPVALVSFFLSLPAFAAPQLTFDKPVYNFQTTTQGTTIVHSFAFRNTGNEPATIERVSSSCGCTVANVSERVVRPGKSGEIKASFDTSDFSGPVTKEIFVSLSGSKNQPYTLLMKGIVTEELVATPPQLNLGDVKAGARKVGVVKLENKGRRNVRIIEIKTASPQMTASAGKRLLKPGEFTSVQVSVTPRADSRFLGGYITIRTDNPGKVEKTIQVYGMVRK
jgi:hypothetical protein